MESQLQLHNLDLSHLILLKSKDDNRNYLLEDEIVNKIMEYKDELAWYRHRLILEVMK